MRNSRNYYEILGLPRGASQAQIARRYRQLARKFHPDVAEDKDAAHRLFIQISEAYEVLSDPLSRKQYDATLIAEPPGTAAKRGEPSSSLDQLLKDAQWSFIQRRFYEAEGHCKRAIRMDGRNAKAYAILGDVYRALDRAENAINAYSRAVQLDPLDRESERKMLALIDKKISTKQDIYVAPASSSKAIRMTIFWASLAAFCIWLIQVFPGEPIPWLNLYIPQIRLWSWNLIGFMAAASVIVGIILSINKLVDDPDEELVFETSGGTNWVLIPTGVLLLIGSGFFFLGAAALYTVVGLLQGSLSRSVLTVFGCVLIVVLLASAMYDPRAKMQVLLYGGNISFLSCLIGWYLGCAAKPLDE